MPHHKARFTARGREAIVRRVVDDGETFAQAAAWANVAKVDRVGVGRALAAGQRCRAGIAELPAGPLKPAGSVPDAGAR